MLRTTLIRLLTLAGLAALAAEIWKFLVVKNSRPSAAGESAASISMIQPITAGVTHLEERLRKRTKMKAELIAICDQADMQSQHTVLECLKQTPNNKLIIIPPEDDGGCALKTAKMKAGIEAAAGEILLFIDDDITLAPETLHEVKAQLRDGRNGAVFGVAFGECFANFWSALLSVFVNRYAFTTYLPVTALIEPYTITGHWYAVRRRDFEQVCNSVLSPGRMDDDHELARCLRALGLRLVQSPVAHGIDNHIESASHFHNQMKRWFVFVREWMLPKLTLKERAVTALAGFPENALPVFVFGSIILRSSRLGGLAALLAAAGVAHTAQAACKARRIIPWWAWPLVPIISLLAPIHVAAILLLGGNRIHWRGRQITVRKDGMLL